MALTYFLNNFEMIPVAPIITGITLVFTIHICCISIVRYLYLYLKIFSAYYYYYFLWLCSPAWAMASSFHEVSWSHTTTRHSQYDSSGRVISPSQRPLPDNTQQTNIHSPSGIRTHDRSRQTARPLGPDDK
jgi:hypothetical protein